MAGIRHPLSPIALRAPISTCSVSTSVWSVGGRSNNIFLLLSPGLSRKVALPCLSITLPLCLLLVPFAGASPQEPLSDACPSDPETLLTQSVGFPLQPLHASSKFRVLSLLWDAFLNWPISQNKPGCIMCTPCSVTTLLVKLVPAVNDWWLAHFLQDYSCC